MAEQKQQYHQEKGPERAIVRIMQTDIPGDKKLFVGFTYIKGVGWNISNGMCKVLNLSKDKKISDLDEKEIEKINLFLKDVKLPVFLLNRRNDFESGENFHLVTNDLDMKKEFDIRRLKKIRSYRGLRHAFGHPTRGQRTRSNFRGKGKAVGVQRKKGAKKK